MEKVYIIKKNGKMYWNLNTCYTSEKRALRSLYMHINSILPRINASFKKSNAFYQERTTQEFVKEFEIIEVEI